MIQKLKRHALIIASVLSMLMPAAVPIAVSAASNGCNSNIAGNVAQGASQAAEGNSGSITCGGTGVGSSGIATLAKNIVNIFSIIVGAVAVIMIIYGGFRYITSGGESGRVGNAKNTLIYAIIGLIIVALAQLIVHFVLNQANNIQTGGSAG